jgi:hypothetical protein
MYHQNGNLQTRFFFVVVDATIDIMVGNLMNIYSGFLLQWRWSTMTRSENFRDVLSVEEFGSVLFWFLVLSSFPSVPMLSRVRWFFWLLNVSVKQLTQLALRVIAPVRQIYTVPRTLVRVSCETLTVAHLRWTLTHVHLAEVKVLVGIHSTVAVAEEVVQLELVTFLHDFLLAIQAVLRSLRMLAWLPRTRSQTTHTPTVSKLSNLILRHVVARSRCQVISPNIVVIAAKSTKLVFVADGRLNLQEVVTIPDEFYAEMRFDNDFVVAALVNLDDIVDDVRKFHARSVHFDAQLLTEVDLDVCHLERDCLRPTRVLSLARIVCHTNGERVIDTICRELILARTLKAEKFAVECLVVWIAEHGTHGGTFDALRAALAFGHDEILVRSTFDDWTLRLSAPNFTSATLA